MMADSGSDVLLSCGQETLQLNKELEQMVETMENTSVQLSWMAYDVVVLRADPGRVQALSQLQEAHDLCAAAVCTRPATTNTDTSTCNTSTCNTSTCNTSQPATSTTTL